MKKTELFLLIMQVVLNSAVIDAFSVVNGSESPIRANCTYGTKDNATRSSTFIPANKSATIKCSHFKGKGLVADEENNRIYTLDLVVNKKKAATINLHQYTIADLDSDALTFYFYADTRSLDAAGSPRFRVKEHYKKQKMSPSLPSVAEDQPVAARAETKHKDELAKVLAEILGSDSLTVEEMLQDLKGSSLSL